MMHAPLFDALPHLKARCGRCLDTNLFRKPSGEVTACPRRCNPRHNKAARILALRVYRRQQQHLWIDARAFDVARILCHYSAENPCKRERLEALFFAEHPDAKTNDGERLIKSLIEALRRDWLLPVGSTKRPPYGHWIMTTLNEITDWRREASSSAITQLATIYRVVRHNTPAFAGQLQFFEELAVEIEAKAAEMEGVADVS